MGSVLYSLNHSLPRDWDNRSGHEMQLIEVCEYSSEFNRIKSKMGDNMPTSIVRVENPYMWSFYSLTKEECTKRRSCTTEEELWHVTCPSSIDSIARDNFDWRRSNRDKYGQGVCFTPDLDHGLRFSTYDGAAILAKVLVGSTDDGYYGLEVPSPSIDTTTGWNGNVYVKYMDNEFYPAYVVYL